MKYDNVIKAEFISRPNRFIAKALIGGEEVTVHVKNTGRCRELLIPGAEIWLEVKDNPKRKTKYDLITVKKGQSLINIDSIAPNKLFHQWALAGGLGYEVAEIRPEYKVGDSRFDFLVDNKLLVEVKGVTLEREGRAYFPDAPTVRGRKHVLELAAMSREGRDACVCFVVQMEGISSVSPNLDTDPDFGKALIQARDSGVRLMAFGCTVTQDGIEPDYEIPVLL